MRFSLERISERLVEQMVVLAPHTLKGKRECGENPADPSELHKKRPFL